MISIVIPVYNSSKSLPELLERLHATLEEEDKFEIILVDDASIDDSWTILEGLKASRFPALRLVQLSKNAGQHNALLCGFSLAKGEIVVTMDDDLQNPPEEVPKLLAKAREGFDLVVGAYDSKEHSRSRNSAGQIVDQTIRWIYRLPRGFQLTSFRAIRSTVIRNVCQMNGVYPYITTMILSHASSYANVAVRHESRRYGRSNYTLKRCLLLVVNLLLNYSSIPVYFVSLLSLLFLCISGGFGVLVVIRTLLQGSSVPGWTTLVGLISLLQSVTLFCLFICTFYLSRINQQLSRSKVSFTISRISDE